MTAARFDPRNLTMYDKAPPLLHFQFGEKVYRYVWVQEFAPKQLDEDTRRTESEREKHFSHDDIRREMFRGLE